MDLEPDDLADLASSLTEAAEDEEADSGRRFSEAGGGLCAAARDFVLALISHS